MCEDISPGVEQVERYEKPETEGPRTTDRVIEPFLWPDAVTGWVSPIKETEIIGHDRITRLSIG